MDGFAFDVLEDCCTSPAVPAACGAAGLALAGMVPAWQILKQVRLTPPITPSVVYGEGAKSPGSNMTTSCADSVCAAVESSSTKTAPETSTRMTTRTAIE